MEVDVALERAVLLAVVAPEQAIAEEAEVAADPDRLVLHDRQPVVTGRRGAGQDALRHAVDGGLLQGVSTGIKFNF